MWLLIFAGLLATSAAKESSASAGKKADDLVLLEIDVKEPSKRSPVAASAVYGSPQSQFIIRHGDDAQELSPEYLALVEQYTNAQPQQQYVPPRTGPPPRRPALPTYAHQQQQLQQAYQNQRVPAVAPPRPRLAYHPQAEAQADAQAEYQAQIEAQNRAEAQRLRASGSTATEYQVPAAYADPKLGTFEQELLQLVSANQAQEFKLIQEQPRRQQKQQAYAQPQYAQQVVAYQEYEKPTVEPVQELPEQQQQYHVETTAQRYPQHVPVNYQPGPEAYQHLQAQPKRPYRPQYVDPAGQQAHAHAEAQNIAQAQANAQAQALAFQKITQASHLKHQEAALEQIRLVNERHQQQSALEQINHGQVSEAGKEHIVEQLRPKDPEEVYRARVKAQAAAQAAEARRAQEASEYKAHADAILALQKQQAAHLKAQEDAHNYALNFEKNQAKAQAQAQAIANSQALALWKAHQAARGKAQKEAQSAARAQSDARQRDPNHTPVIQYLLPQNVPLPEPKDYIYTEEFKNYQAGRSNYVQRSTPKPDAEEPVAHQARLIQKHKVPAGAQASSVYVSQSGHLKKAPVKGLSIEDIIEQNQVGQPQIFRIPAGKAQALTPADLNVLVQAGYTVTPVPDVPRPTQQPYENSSTGYYVKKHSAASPRPEFVAYDDSAAHLRPRLTRKQRPILRQEAEGDFVPVDPNYGVKTSQRRLVAEE